MRLYGDMLCQVISGVALHITEYLVLKIEYLWIVVQAEKIF